MTEATLVEEEVEEEVLVHVRFPDYERFGDVRFIPRADEPVLFVSADTDTAVDASGNPVVAVVENSLFSSQPQFRFGRYVFDGEWSSEHQCASRNASNMVILGFAHESPAVPTQSADQTQPSVASLLEHLPHGRDQDTVTKKRRLEKDEDRVAWQCASVISPETTLVLRRVR